MTHTIKFGTLHPDGNLTNIRFIKQSSMMGKCPFFIMVPEHYNEDGSCKCHDFNHRKNIMSKWGYTKRDFIRAGIIPKEVK